MFAAFGSFPNLLQENTKLLSWNRIQPLLSVSFFTQCQWNDKMTCSRSNQGKQFDLRSWHTVRLKLRLEMLSQPKFLLRPIPRKSQLDHTIKETRRKQSWSQNFLIRVKYLVDTHKICFFFFFVNHSKNVGVFCLHYKVWHLSHSFNTVKSNFMERFYIAAD